MRLSIIAIFLFIYSCSDEGSLNTAGAGSLPAEKQKAELISLEKKWLEAEFALDTGYISTLMDDDFIDISAGHIHNKQEALKGIFDNINRMRKDSIFLDSLKLEEVIINLYENTAIVSLVTHSYKKSKGKPIEKRTKFYDVWIKRDGKWKAVSSQGTVISNNLSI